MMKMRAGLTCLLSLGSALFLGACFDGGQSPPSRPELPPTRAPEGSMLRALPGQDRANQVGTPATSGPGAGVAMVSTGVTIPFLRPSIMAASSRSRTER